MQLSDLEFLQSPAGQALLQETAATPITPHNHLIIATRLRRQVGPQHAHAVLETTLLRQAAASKFSRAAQMYFTRPALEQASGEIIAAYRAQRFAALGCRTVADLGCGIGGDAIALAAPAAVLGVDRNRLRLAMACANVAAYGRAANFQPVQADLQTLTAPCVDALFFDPSRRTANGRRIHSVHHYQPPLGLIDAWRTRVPTAAVKISPGVDYAELPADADVEFISVQGEVKEGVLWYGALRTHKERQATLLPAGHSLGAADAPGPDVAITPPRTYLYEPDGAVIRAHLIQPLARLLDATQIDAQIAYLTTDSQQPTPFARCFAIEAWFPFQLKRLRHYLRAHHVGRVVIKKRGSPLEPDTLQRQLRLRGTAERILFLTHVQGETAVLIGTEALVQAP